MKPVYYQRLRGWAAPLLLLLCGWACVWLLPRDTFVSVIDDALWAALPVEQGPLVYVVDIDDASLGELGRWPWPRERLARLVRRLGEEYRAAVIGLDIVLSEPAAGDRAFGLATQGLPLVWAVAPALPGEAALQQGRLGRLPPCAAEMREPAAVGYLGVSDTLASPGMRVGHVRPWPDGDGVIRRYVGFVSLPEGCVPGLGLALWGAWLGLAPNAPLTRVDGELRWGGVALGVAADGMMRLRNLRRAVRSVAAVEVMRGEARLPPGAIVLVGSSALGMGDIVALPGVGRTAGVNVHALALAQWLSGGVVRGERWRAGVEFGLLLAAFWGALCLSRVSVFWLGWYWLLLLGGWCGLSALGFRLGFMLSSAPLLWGTLLLPLGLGVRLWQARSARNLLYRQFSAYLSREVLEELVRHGTDPRTLEAQSCEITILFADIRQFTALSEALPSAQVVRLLNEVMSFLARHVASHGGTLDKFLGDGVMAFWGAPLPMEDHADRAVACACRMMADLAGLNARLRANGWPAIRLGIGIHTGEAAVGNMGSSERRAYTAVGDAVNLAARLEALSSHGLAAVLVSEACVRRCRAHRFRYLGRQAIRGRRAGVEVYTPCGLPDGPPDGGPAAERVVRPDGAAARR